MTFPWENHVFPWEMALSHGKTGWPWTKIDHGQNIFAMGKMKKNSYGQSVIELPKASSSCVCFKLFNYSMLIYLLFACTCI